MVGLFPSREASGTAWLPDETPMFGIARTWRGWEIMLHGSAFAQFLYEPGDKHRTGGFNKSPSLQCQLGNGDGAASAGRRPCRPSRDGEH